MRDKEVLKEFEGVKCEICNNPASSIVRGKNTCQKCFSILSRDNARLFKKDKDIPNDISYLKGCGYYPCNNKFMSKIIYDNDNIIKEYCSEDCKLKDLEVQNRKNT